MADKAFINDLLARYGDPVPSEEATEVQERMRALLRDCAPDARALKRDRAAWSRIAASIKEVTDLAWPEPVAMAAYAAFWAGEMAAQAAGDDASGGVKRARCPIELAREAFELGARARREKLAERDARQLKNASRPDVN